MTDRKSCLIVDESKFIRMVARKILQELGFDTFEAADGQQALQASQAALPDVVLLERTLPVMDGMAYLQALRQLPNGDETMVIFCSTKNDPAAIQQAVDAGADEYIMKPFDSDILQAKLSLVGLL